MWSQVLVMQDKQLKVNFKVQIRCLVVVLSMATSRFVGFARIVLAGSVSAVQLANIGTTTW